MLSNIKARQKLGTDHRIGLAAAAVAVAVALIGFRLLLVPLDQTELSIDEAQYWFWGQELSFGAYSKPPLIGWVIRLSTELFGQSVWAVRLPAVVFHAATAAVIFLCARRVTAQPVPALAALFYLVTPAVALGSAVMTTDTPLLLAAAVALLAQLRAAEARSIGQRAQSAALLLGLALGIGILAKHAMVFWLVGCVSAAFLSPALRPGRGDAFLAFAVMLAVVAPHLLWLYQHGFVTLLHIQAITQGPDLSLFRPLRFLAEQLLVAGPIVFLAMWAGLFRDVTGLGLSALFLVPLLIVVGQGFKGPVLANWAVLYLVPGSILAATWLVRRRWLVGLTLIFGLAVSVAVPLVKAVGTGLQRPDGRLLLSRYLGHSAIASWAMDTAFKRGATVLVAQDRDLLADLSWFSAGSGLAIRAVPPAGRPAHHWEMAAPYVPGTDADPLLLLRAGAKPPCPDAQEIARLPGPPGFASRDTLLLFTLPDPSCLASRPHEDPQ